MTMSAIHHCTPQATDVLSPLSQSKRAGWWVIGSLAALLARKDGEAAAEVGS